MCSSGGKVGQTDQALQDAQAKMTATLNQDYNTTFAEQQSVLGQQKARLDYIAANPMGYSPRELHTATASINDNTARAAKQALGSAAAFAASHGGADIGGGAVGQVAGVIGSEAAQSKAGQLSSLSQQNEEMKQKNFWSAISGLNSVGSELGGSGGTAISGATSTAGTAVNAGSGALAAQNAGWEHLSGVLGGISGLAKSGAGAYSDIVNA
jgi:hypothetical protein